MFCIFKENCSPLLEGQVVDLFVWALYGVILFLLQRIQIESIQLGGEG